MSDSEPEQKSPSDSTITARAKRIRLEKRIEKLEKQIEQIELQYSELSHEQWKHRCDHREEGEKRRRKRSQLKVDVGAGLFLAWMFGGLALGGILGRLYNIVVGVVAYVGSGIALLCLFSFIGKVIEEPEDESL